MLLFVFFITAQTHRIGAAYRTLVCAISSDAYYYTKYISMCNIPQ